jgi:hypothetical protein
VLVNRYFGGNCGTNDSFMWIQNPEGKVFGFCGISLLLFISAIEFTIGKVIHRYGKVCG